MKFSSLFISLGAFAFLAMLDVASAQGQNSPRYKVVDLGR